MWRVTFVDEITYLIHDLHVVRDVAATVQRKAELRNADWLRF
jgi:hypothetical protein